MKQKQLKAYRFDSVEEREALKNHYGEQYFGYVPDRGYDSAGYLYQQNVERPFRHWTSGECDSGWDIILFKDALVPIERSFEEHLALANSYIGKKVYVTTIQHAYTVTRVSVGLKGENYGKGSNVANALLSKDWVIVLANGVYANPVQMVKLAPETKSLKISDDYTATIYKDRVEVGCQTVSKDTLAKILLEMETL